MKDDWEYYSAGDGTWYVYDISSANWIEISEVDTERAIWLTEQGQIVDGTIFKYVCDGHSGNLAYGARSLFKTKKKNKVMKQLKKYGRVQFDDATTGSYYKCTVDQHQSASVCLDGDKDFDTPKFCKNNKKLKLAKNIIKKFNINYNKFLNTNNDTLQTCFQKIGDPLHHEIYRYNHAQLYSYKKQYGKAVSRKAWIVSQAFPAPSKKKNAPVKPTCYISGKGNPSLKKQKKTMTKALKKLGKIFEKSYNYCS